MCRSEDSVLLIVDVQERLAAAMPEEARAMVVRSAGILLQAAGLLGIPVFLTEQYPKGLGPTESAILAHLGPGVRRFDKMSFSCCGDENFTASLLATGRRQAVLAGMEAHVCVLQTALDLHSAGVEVYVAEDGVSSRNQRNSQNALNRLRQAGITVTNTESVVFEWLRDARHEQFKAISALVR